MAEQHHLLDCERLFASIDHILSPTLKKDAAAVLAKCRVLWPHDVVPQRNKMFCVKLIRAMRDKILSTLKKRSIARNKTWRRFQQFNGDHLCQIVAINKYLAWRPVPYMAHAVEQQLSYENNRTVESQENISKLFACKYDTLALFHVDTQTWTHQGVDPKLCPGDFRTLDTFVDVLQKHLELRWIHVTRDLDGACSSNSRTLTVVVESERLTSLWLGQSDDNKVWQKRFQTIRDAGASVLYLQPDTLESPPPEPFYDTTKIHMFLTNYRCAIKTMERFFFLPHHDTHTQ